MNLNLSYPVSLILQEDGNWLVSSDDIPEALSEGENRKDAMSEAKDCLIAALGGYMNADRDIPRPSYIQKGTEIIVLPILLSAKIALYRAIRESGIIKHLALKIKH